MGGTGSVMRALEGEPTHRGCPGLGRLWSWTVVLREALSSWMGFLILVPERTQTKIKLAYDSILACFVSNWAPGNDSGTDTVLCCSASDGRVQAYQRSGASTKNLFVSNEPGSPTWPISDCLGICRATTQNRWKWKYGRVFKRTIGKARRHERCYICLVFNHLC